MKSPCRLAAILASALAFIACSGQTASPSASPVGQDPAIKQYQAMLGADEQRVLSSQSNHCNTIDDTGCPGAVAVVIAGVQQWLDDLNRSRPPIRFAYVDVQIRRHLERVVSDGNSVVAAFRAKDLNGMKNAIAAAVSERDALESEASDIIASSQGTIATYASGVRMDRSNLLACDFCQRLVSQSQNQVSCQASQVPSCVDEIAATRLQVETFQGDLVRILAPDSLVAKDWRLQADLFTAYVALGAMTSALSAHDQFELMAGFDALRQALGQADSDAADIAKGV